ncbi:MAG: hypothetical protein ACK4ND_15300 [Cytophagaceae bacterium]
MNYIKQTMEFIESLLTVENKLSNFLIFVFFIFSLFLLILGIILKGEENKTLKVGGILLITFLAILSKSSVAFVITIFINATIIAKLDFLEKLAAIIFKNKEYFHHLIELNKSSKKENIDNKVKEVMENIPSDKTKSKEQVRKDIEDYVSDVGRFLESKGFMKKYNFNEYYRIDHSDKNKIYLDALGRTNTTDFIYEIKNINNQAKLYEILRQLESYIEVYKQYLERAQISRKVKALLVVDKDIQTDNIILNKIGILKFNKENKEIINLAEVESWMDEQ